MTRLCPAPRDCLFLFVQVRIKPEGGGRGNESRPRAMWVGAVGVCRRSLNKFQRRSRRSGGGPPPSPFAVRQGSGDGWSWRRSRRRWMLGGPVRGTRCPPPECCQPLLFCSTRPACFFLKKKSLTCVDIFFPLFILNFFNFTKKHSTFEGWLPPPLPGAPPEPARGQAAGVRAVGAAATAPYRWLRVIPRSPAAFLWPIHPIGTQNIALAFSS